MRTDVVATWRAEVMDIIVYTIASTINFIVTAIITDGALDDITVIVESFLSLNNGYCYCYG